MDEIPGIIDELKLKLKTEIYLSISNLPNKMIF